MTFPFPEGQGVALALSDVGGVQIPLQLSDDGTATFILEALDAGEEAHFEIVELSATLGSHVTASDVNGGVRLGVDTSTLVDFQTTGDLPGGVDPVYLRGGYLHPVYTPAGVRVTDDYPGDHRHHHGIWTAWTSTDFNGHDVDFWNMASQQGKVDFVSLDDTWQGPVHAGVSATLEHVDLVPFQSVTALNEHWVVRAYKTHEGPAPYFVFDLESTQEAATASPLNLHEYHYGGFAMRGHEAWRNVNNVTFLTSEGDSRATGDDETGKWCYVGGDVGGTPVGFAMLGHPANFRAPQKMRIHPSDPYMAFAPVKDGAFSIEQNAPYVTGFRIVTVDGPPDAVLLNRLWEDYATPPTVTVNPGG